MNRITIALLAALEAAISVAIGLGIALVPLTILWATGSGLSADWTVFWRAAADVWLLGHGVDLTITLPAAFVSALALPGADAAFTVSIALLGFALLTIVLGVGAGRRAGHSAHPVQAAAIVVAVFWGLAALIAVSARHPIASPAAATALLLPGLVYAASVLTGLALSRRAVLGTLGRRLAAAVRSWVDELNPVAVRLIAESLRGGTIAAAVILAAGALLFCLSLFTRYATVIGLYESLQAGALGGIALTLLQLALLPNAVIWSASWVVGPGFAVGAGSSVSPGATVLGPVPGLPLLGALPDGSAGPGFLVLLVPILAGFAIGMLLRQRMTEAKPSAPILVGQGLAAGVVAGVILGMLAWISAGSAGPGRLQEVGPNPWLVAAFAALEVGLPAVLGLYAGAVSVLPSRFRRSAQAKPESEPASEPAAGPTA
ncbi:cell division protein PerM [Microterricola viridarii]|uniref:Integral membrane protein n=1 Tax=Microterricola viridarii TaxID=412690 RepID=A0A1H1QH07_9MICO|nr:DUF6350 family protein [Microterricola viridarii]SDS22169.1 hypothetical protein SAMN04489834_1080 [Microterricola viridarii]